MRTNRLGKLWESVGRTRPYWGAISHDTYCTREPSADTLDKFFLTGERYLDAVLSTVASKVDGTFRPRSALEFGCGAGRVLVALARRCVSVVGVDVAASMLSEARANCDRLGLTNVQLLRADEMLSGVSGPFDLIHSFIVLQHIPARRGRRLVRRVLELIGDSGVGVIHLTYGTRESYPLRKLRAVIGQAARSCAAAAGLGAVRREAPGGRAPRALRLPRLPIYMYSMSKILSILYEGGVRRLHVEFTDHGGCYGALLFFQRCGDGACLA